MGLLSPTLAHGHQPGLFEDAVLGRQHMLEHMKVARAQMRERRQWRRMTPAERRRATRAQRRAERQAFVRAHAAAGDPSELGSWAPPFVMTTGYEGYAVHAAMLHTGKVLMWGRQGAPRGRATYAWLWDPAKGYGDDAVRDVTPTGASGNNIPIFCSGMSFLPDGRVLVVGGTLMEGNEDPLDDFTTWAGINSAIVFDSATEEWTELPRPAGSKGRWYPTQVLLGDGRTLVVSGLTEDPPGGLLNDAPEIYNTDTNAFTLLETPEQRRDMALYPHLFTMPDGTVLLAGPAQGDSEIFDPANLANPWTDLPPLATRRDGANAILLPDGTDGSTTVAAIGGRPSKGSPPAFNEMIDLADPTPTWLSFPALAAQRVWANTLQLPDGSMVTIGGNDMVDDSTFERAVELYDPVTGTWRTGPSQVETRAYHSTALLLPDGRVLSTGDDRNPPSPDDTGEVYSPPYLFKGPRPEISSAPGAFRWNVPFGVGTPGDIDSAVLIAPSAVTHANDMSQRLVPLAIVAEHAGGYTLQTPPSANVAPPGWYMLFVLNDGVPSLAKWVRLDGSAPDVAAIPPEPEPEPDPTSDPEPGAPDAPGALPDAAGPGLELRFPERRWLRRLRRDGALRVRVTVDERAIVDARLLRRTKRLAHKRVEMRAGTRRLELTPRRRVIRWLRRTEHPRLRLSVFATDTSDNQTAWTRRLRR